MEGSEIVLYRMGEKGVPTVLEFLTAPEAGGTLLAWTAWSPPPAS